MKSNKHDNIPKFCTTCGEALVYTKNAKLSSNKKLFDAVSGKLLVSEERILDGKCPNWQEKRPSMFLPFLNLYPDFHRGARLIYQDERLIQKYDYFDQQGGRLIM